ncbi:EscU/YscU/HrcU family type III secretion system export apparatus switch protein [Paraburkholderia bannensis]|uniref:EscU/YscU/HrcU family type III secretion system export apparatus switch protein n=1 Tax=Paraburkholderia bannensis TaxID=765414 RepID=UPI002AB6AA01|nr:EscU/YscU/HrcU family type III secretion system export apparatus switch protein [Paraburkholderia bannensis]
MSDKTEKPSGRRLQRARRDGDITKSAHLSTAVSGLFWWLLLIFEAPVLFGEFEHALGTITSLDNVRPFAWQCAAALDALMAPTRTALAMSAFGLMAVIVPELVQTRGLVALKRVAPDLNRINPIEGIKNLVSWKIVSDTVVTIFQFGILIFIAWKITIEWISLAVPAYALTTSAQLALVANTHSHLLALIGLSQLGPAVVDYALQLRLRLRRLRMDKEEVKRELREEQGDPFVRGRRRAFHQQVNQ